MGIDNENRMLKNYLKVLELRRFDLSMYRYVNILVCRRLCFSTFRFVDISVCRRFGLSTFWFVDVLSCRCFGLSTFRFVDVLTSNRWCMCKRMGGDSRQYGNRWECRRNVGYFLPASMCLTLEPHLYVNELGHHWSRLWLVACSAPTYYLNQCWLIVNYLLRNKLQWNSNQHTKRFINENAFKSVVCDMAVILSRRRWIMKAGFSSMPCGL